MNTPGYFGSRALFVIAGEPIRLYSCNERLTVLPPQRFRRYPCPGHYGCGIGAFVLFAGMRFRCGRAMLAAARRRAGDIGLFSLAVDRNGALGWSRTDRAWVGPGVCDFLNMGVPAGMCRAVGDTSIVITQQRASLRSGGLPTVARPLIKEKHVKVPELRPATFAEQRLVGDGEDAKIMRDFHLTRLKKVSKLPALYKRSAEIR